MTWKKSDNIALQRYQQAIDDGKANASDNRSSAESENSASIHEISDDDDDWSELVAGPSRVLRSPSGAFTFDPDHGHMSVLSRSKSNAALVHVQCSLWPHSLYRSFATPCTYYHSRTIARVE